LLAERRAGIPRLLAWREPPRTAIKFGWLSGASTYRPNFTQIAPLSSAQIQFYISRDTKFLLLIFLPLPKAPQTLTCPRAGKKNAIGTLGKIVYYSRRLTVPFSLDSPTRSGGAIPALIDRQERAMYQGTRRTTGPLIVIIIAILAKSAAFGQHAEEATLKTAAAVLSDAMSKPDNRIPEKMLEDAYGVAIIPNVIKGSFVVGVRRGRGVLFVREPDGVWHAPVFVTLIGGNVGWQAGVQSSDVILVFKTPRSVQGIMSGKLTIGGDAAAAAGPLGRQGAVATDGSVLHLDQFATSAYYRSPAPGLPVVIPPLAEQLTHSIAGYAGAKFNPQIPAQQPVLSRHHLTSEADLLRFQLFQVAPELYELIDEPWQQYLALPPAIFSGTTHPQPEEVGAVLRRFEEVARDARYRSLAARAEFQSVDGLLRHYYQTLSSKSVELQLPPPPPIGASR